MNKKEFIKELLKSTTYSEEKCILVNDILERYPLIGKKNKNKFTNDFVSELGISLNEACELYNICMNIISKELKYKLKHPFGNKKGES